MEMNKMCDLENCDPNDLSRPSVSPTDRRLFLAGALALPLATILANVDLAEAQAAKGVSIKQTTADGRTVSAYFAEADKKDAPVVILIHEWWGLNDNIKTMAEDIRAKGFHAIAIDLFNGSVTANADSLQKLNAPLLGHFGTLDKSINPEMVGAFQKNLAQAGKSDLMTTHWYTAGHAFANPTGGRYDEDDAALAWARTHTFLAAHLR